LLGYFLKRMRDTNDGDGSLLDHSMILYGGGLGNGNIHDHMNLPCLLAGGAAGHLKGGRHVAYPVGEQDADGEPASHDAGQGRDSDAGENRGQHRTSGRRFTKSGWHAPNLSPLSDSRHAAGQIGRPSDER